MLLCVADLLRSVQEVSKELHSPFHRDQELFHLLTVESDEALLHLH